MGGASQTYKFGLMRMQPKLSRSLIGESFPTRREWRVRFED